MQCLIQMLKMYFSSREVGVMTNAIENKSRQKLKYSIQVVMPLTFAIFVICYSGFAGYIYLF